MKYILNEQYILNENTKYILLEAEDDMPSDASAAVNNLTPNDNPRLRKHIFDLYDKLKSSIKTFDDALQPFVERFNADNIEAMNKVRAASEDATTVVKDFSSGQNTDQLAVKDAVGKYLTATQELINTKDANGYANIKQARANLSGALTKFDRTKDVQAIIRYFDLFKDHFDTILYNDNSGYVTAYKLILNYNNLRDQISFDTGTKEAVLANYNDKVVDEYTTTFESASSTLFDEAKNIDINNLTRTVSALTKVNSALTVFNNNIKNYTDTADAEGSATNANSQLDIFLGVNKNTNWDKLYTLCNTTEQVNMFWQKYISIMWAGHEDTLKIIQTVFSLTAKSYGFTDKNPFVAYLNIIFNELDYKITGGAFDAIFYHYRDSKLKVGDLKADSKSALGSSGRFNIIFNRDFCLLSLEEAYSYLNLQYRIISNKEALVKAFTDKSNPSIDKIYTNIMYADGDAEDISKTFDYMTANTAKLRNRNEIGKLLDIILGVEAVNGKQALTDTELTRVVHKLSTAECGMALIALVNSALPQLGDKLAAMKYKYKGKDTPLSGIYNAVFTENSANMNFSKISNVLEKLELKSFNIKDKELTLLIKALINRLGKGSGEASETTATAEENIK